MKFEYPLQWLNQQPRTNNPQRSKFGGHSTYYAGEMLTDELRRLGAKNCLVSSNLMTKKDGTFHARQSRIDDAGIVVYFDLKGQSKAMACDKWDLPQHNIWALYLSISAIRGLERWGGSEFLDGLFTGFKALPSPEDIIISSVQYFQGLTDKDEIKARFRELAKKLHPDLGGDTNEFQELNRQYKQVMDNEF